MNNIRNSQKNGAKNFAAFAVLMALSATFASSAWSASVSWGCGSDWWDTAACWTPSGQPVAGNDVYLNSSDGQTREVRYFNNLNSSDVLNSLSINATNGGSMSLSILQPYPSDLSTSYEFVGKSGNGLVVQNSGEHTVTNDLYLGYGIAGIGMYQMSDSGNPNLSRATLSAGNEYIGYSGAGGFTQSGGTNKVTNGLYLGALATGTGVYKLQSGYLEADHIAGGLGSSSLYVDGGVLSVGSGSGTIMGSVTNLTVFGVGSSYGSWGAQQMDGGTLSAQNEYIGGAGLGLLIQNGGDNTVKDTLFLGNESTVINTGSSLQTIPGSGTYNLNGGTLAAKNVVVGGKGVGEFNQTGGSNTVSSTLLLAAQPGSTGTYNLSGGTLAVNEMQINSGGVFNRTGGLFTANELTNNGNISAYGSLQIGRILTNNGGIKLGGNGRIGGERPLTVIGGNILNTVMGTVEVAHNPATFTGNVVNDGTFKTTDTTVRFTGLFTNNGRYYSDPSDNYFTDLVINTTGHLEGGVGDNFYINGDFRNYSEQNMLWNTIGAYLGFIDGADSIHDLYLTGDDLGAILGGYTNNFAWGTLNLDSGNSMSLFDGNAADGGALYVNSILGLDITGMFVNNINGNNLNIYYLASATGNDYLHGLDYQLSNGGWLRAVRNSDSGSVPEPGTFLLMGAGFIGLARFRRKVACS